MARHSPALILVHAVWATFRRAKCLRPESDGSLAAIMGSKVIEHGCGVVAVGIAPDHVHALLRMSTTCTVAAVVGAMKGVSSRALAMQVDGVPLGWQRGHWAECA